MFDILSRLRPQRSKQPALLVPAMRGIENGSYRWHTLNIAGGLALVLARQEDSAIQERFSFSKQLYRKIVELDKPFSTYGVDRSLVSMAYQEVRILVDGQTRMSFIAVIQKSTFYPSEAAPASLHIAIKAGQGVEAQSSRFKQSNDCLKANEAWLVKREFHNTDSSWFDETRPLADDDPVEKTSP